MSNQDPDFQVQFDQEEVRDNAIYGLLQQLGELDIEMARRAIFKAPGADPDIRNPVFVGASDEGSLIMGVNAMETTFWVNVDPTKFDRTNPKQEGIFQKCAALVKMIHESPIPDGEGNPFLSPFIFWKWPEVDPNDDATERWAKLAEVWAAAASQAT